MVQRSYSCGFKTTRQKILFPKHCPRAKNEVLPTYLGKLLPKSIRESTNSHHSSLEGLLIDVLAAKSFLKMNSAKIPCISKDDV